MQRRPILRMLSCLPALAIGRDVAAAPLMPRTTESLIHDLPRTTEALFDLTRGAVILPSSHIEMIAESLVEYSPRWPVRVVTRLPGASWMVLVIEQNPQPLAALFQFKTSVVSEISSSVKLADNTQVTVVVAAAGRFYGLRRFITVVGNCG